MKSNHSSDFLVRPTFEIFEENSEEDFHFGVDTETVADPYDSVWLKILTIFVYFLEILASAVMLAFVSYESQGLAGHYRTVINQLISYLYGGVSMTCVHSKYIRTCSRLLAPFVYFAITKPICLWAVLAEQHGQYT